MKFSIGTSRIFIPNNTEYEIIRYRFFLNVRRYELIVNQILSFIQIQVHDVCIQLYIKFTATGETHPMGREITHSNWITNHKTDYEQTTYFHQHNGTMTTHHIALVIVRNWQGLHSIKVKAEMWKMHPKKKKKLKEFLFQLIVMIFISCGIH